MDKEKQIEEMAKIICAPTANKGNCDKCGFKRHCSKFDDATDLYNAGYRKASDVAEEIFAELDTFIVTKVIDHGTLKYDIGDKYKALKQKYSVALPTIAELKKKYTESEKDK